MDSVLFSFGSLKHSSSRADRNPAHFPWWISQCSYQGATSCPNLVIQSLFLFGSQKWTRTRRTSTPVSPPLPVLVLAAELKILLWNSFRPLSLLSFSKTGKQQLAPFSLHLLSLWEEFLVETIGQPITFTCEKTQRIVFWCSFFFFSFQRKDFAKHPLDRESFVLIYLPCQCYLWKLRRIREPQRPGGLMNWCLLLRFPTELLLNIQGEVLWIAPNQCCPQCAPRTPGSCHHEGKIHEVSGLHPKAQGAFVGHWQKA